MPKIQRLALFIFNLLMLSSCISLDIDSPTTYVWQLAVTECVNLLRTTCDRATPYASKLAGFEG